jgi:SAM-dependent methyltransferase
MNMNTESPEIKKELKTNVLKESLRTPGGKFKLNEKSPEMFISEDGTEFPVYDGVVCGLPVDERGSDLGDAKFYEENPFGVRDWSNPKEVEAGVEKDLKDLLAKTPKDALIGDIGAGSGRVSNYISLQGFTNVMSIDYALNSIKMVNQNSNNFCVWGNILQLPVATDTFDLAICTGVIHHTPDPERAFSECCRVVKPDGLFYMKVRNLWSPYGILFHTYGAFLRFFYKIPALKWIADLFGFQVYKLTRTVFYSHLPKRPDPELRGKFENLFIKKLITFFTTSQVKKMLSDNNMEIVTGRKTEVTHWQHFYISRKKK